MAVADITDLLASEEFSTLWREVNMHNMSRRDFDGMAMPCGMSRDEMYTIVERLMCLAGIELPFRPYVVIANPAHVWVSLTNEVRSRIDYINRMAGSVSDLSAYVRSADEYLQVPLAIEEMITCCRLDGFDISLRRANALWSGAEQASTDADRAFVLLCTLFTGTRHYGHRSLTRGFIEAVHERFMDELSGEEEPSQLSTARLTGADYMNDDYYNPSKTLDTVAAILADRSIPTVIAALQSQLFMLDLKPYREFNHCTSLIVHKIYYEEVGLPLMAFVPLATVMQEWTDGSYDVDLPESALLLEAGDVADVGLDATPYTSMALFMIQHEVAKLEKAITAQKAQLDGIEERVKQDSDLNVRQKSALVRLVRHPRIILTIEDYRDAHGVSYSTARKDLLDLASLGYLEVRKSSLATTPFTFSIGKKLLLLAYKGGIRGIAAPKAQDC